VIFNNTIFDKTKGAERIKEGVTKHNINNYHQQQPQNVTLGPVSMNINSSSSNNNKIVARIILVVRRKNHHHQISPKFLQ
jgi:hypothetical protein